MNSKDAVGQVYGPRVTTKSCNVCALCAVCPGGMYRQCFRGGLAMVIAVNVGHKWALLRLSCLRWHILGICQDAGWGGGLILVAAGRQGQFATHSVRRVFLEGALRGRSPRTREGRIGPTAHNCSDQ